MILELDTEGLRDDILVAEIQKVRALQQHVRQHEDHERIAALLHRLLHDGQELVLALHHALGVDAGDLADAEVVVRGTKFNLKAYDDSSDVETVLVEGAVDFRAADHVVALHPGQKVSYNPTDNDLTLQTVNVEAELAARLRTFRHVDLAQIAGVIEDFYGIGVAFRSEALKNIQFTGTLDFNMPIDHILEVLTLSTNTRFNRNGEKITIHK